ncbi:MAG: biotin/lipoyl-binding protein, partial [Myxococcota bacterium]|nr:biotin/lipoyl-binding protein [Myxococcota bacterium]
MADQLSNNLAALKIDRSAGRRPPGSSLWKNLVIAALLLGGAGAAYVYGVPLLEAKVFKTEVELTEVALVSPAQAAIELTSTGYLVPQTLSKIAAKIGGRVAKVHVRQGSDVKAGDVLIEIDPSDHQANVASAQSQVAA